MAMERLTMGISCSSIEIIVGVLVLCTTSMLCADQGRMQSVRRTAVMQGGGGGGIVRGAV